MNNEFKTNYESSDTHTAITPRDYKNNNQDIIPGNSNGSHYHYV